jgi:hypothetical protein
MTAGFAPKGGKLGVELADGFLFYPALVLSLARTGG